MSLSAELSTLKEQFHLTAPKPVLEAILTSTNDFVASWNPEDAIRVGQAFTAFNLSDATGKLVSSSELFAKGPVLISFYRGEWCPFCNLELRALQKHLSEFEEMVVTLVAISPELPQQAFSTQEKNELQFTVLSDVGNELARSLGILFPQPETMRPIFGAFGIDMIARNGDASLELPIAATYLVDSSGIIRNAFIDPDYTRRLEPLTALSWATELKNEGIVDRQEFAASATEIGVLGQQDTDPSSSRLALNV